MAKKETQSSVDSIDHDQVDIVETASADIVEAETTDKTPGIWAVDSNTVEIILVNPLSRASREVDTLRVRKPKASDLGRISIQSIIDQVPTAVAEVAPRVISPSVTKKEILEMDLTDFVLVCSAITLFFTNGLEARQEVAQNITESIK